MPSKRKQTEDQYARAAALREKGWIQLRISKAMGLSRQRVQQILAAIRNHQVRSVTCGRCGEALCRAGRGRPVGGNPLCLGCLEKLPGAPFGQRLLAFRLAASLTQLQLASKSGVTATMIGTYEAGRGVPIPSALAKLVKVLPGLAEGEKT